MSRGPGKVESAILSAFRAAPDSTFTTGELAVVAFGTEWPSKAQRVSILRAAKSAAKRIFDAKEAYWKFARDEAPQAQLIFYNAANIRSYSLMRRRTDFCTNGYSLDYIEKQIDEPNEQYAALMREGGAWWAYSNQFRLEMLGITSGPEFEAVETTIARIKASFGVMADAIREAASKIH